MSHQTLSAGTASEAPGAAARWKGLMSHQDLIGWDGLKPLEPPLSPPPPKPVDSPPPGSVESRHPDLSERLGHAFFVLPHSMLDRTTPFLLTTSYQSGQFLLGWPY